MASSLKGARALDLQAGDFGVLVNSGAHEMNAGHSLCYLEFSF